MMASLLDRDMVIDEIDFILGCQYELKRIEGSKRARQNSEDDVYLLVALSGLGREISVWRGGGAGQIRILQST